MLPRHIVQLRMNRSKNGDPMSVSLTLDARGSAVMATDADGEVCCHVLTSKFGEQFAG